MDEGCDNKIELWICQPNRFCGEALEMLVAAWREYRTTIITDSLDDLADRVETEKPEVLLISGQDNAELVSPFLEQHHQRLEGIKILLHDMQLMEIDLIEMVRLGVCGFLERQASSEQIRSAIRCVAGGELWINRKLTARLVSRVVEHRMEKAKTDDYNLTPREREVLSLLSTGMNNGEIGESLYISSTTVKCHLNRIFKKIGVSNRYEAIIFSMNAMVHTDIQDSGPM